MVKCIIIDNNKYMIEFIQSHVLTRQELLLKSTFTKPLDAIEYLQSNAIDLVFLDIEMPKLRGLDLIERVRNLKQTISPSFILITGFPKYAVESYEYNVVDYIMKPVSLKRFNVAVDKYLISHSIQKNIIENLKDKEFSFFFIEIDGKRTKIKFEEIVYISSDTNYTQIHQKNRKLLVRKNIGEVEAVLDPKLFLRIHKSYIVAINSIYSVSPLMMEVEFQNSIIQLPIGRTYKDYTREILNLD